MAVTKKNGYNAPYRSATFQRQAEALTQRNGVIAMDGVVSESGGLVTVPPFEFIQQGLLVKDTVQRQIASSSMAAPFFLTVSAATSAEVDDLTLQYAKSPADVAETEVIIAEYDGDEWRMMPFVSIDGVYDDLGRSYADFDLVGPFKGLITSYNAPNYENTPGVIVDKQGFRRRLTETAIFPEIVDDPEASWTRVDRVIYRRPNDDENRVGVRRLELGGTWAAGGPAKINQTNPFISDNPRPVFRSVIASDNTAHVLIAQGYGDQFGIWYMKYNAARSSALIAATQLFTATEADFDAVIDENDEIHIAYINSGNVELRRFDSVGAAIGGATVIDNNANPSTLPRVAIDPSSNNVFVTWQRFEGAANNQIFFAKMTLGGSVATGPVNLIGNLSDLERPDIFVTDDLWVYVAWQDTTTTKVWYQVFDDVGLPLDGSVPVEVSASTDKGGPTLTDGAHSPKIRVFDNRSVLVTFLQDKGGSVYGLGIWQDGSAYMLDLVSGGENFTHYWLQVDDIHNGIHLLMAQSGQADYVKVENGAVTFTESIAGGGTQDVFLIRDKTGSMLHLWTDPASGSFTDYDTGLAVDHIGPASVVGSLATINLNSDQWMLNVAAPSQVPRVAERVTIASSSNGNDGAYIISAVELVGLNSVNDRYRITVTPVFPNPETPAAGVTCNLGSPDSNPATFVKSTSELEAPAFRYDELDTDVLLARIVRPGPIILNYIPGGGGPVVSSDLFTPYGMASIDWEVTTGGELTIANGLMLKDLVNNLDYSIANGGYPMSEDDALYVTLNGVDLNPTPQVTSIATLPFGTPIQVLGIIRDSRFAPQLLGVAGMGALESGETSRVDNDLPQDVRTRLGIQSDVSVASYPYNIGFNTSDNYPTAIGQTNIMAGQNRHIRLVKPTVDWTLGTNTLTFTSEGFVQIPGLTEARNRIAPQSVVIDANDKIAYVDVNRETGVAANLTVNVALISAVALTRNTIVIARRVNDEIIMDPSGISINVRDRLGITNDTAIAPYITNIGFGATDDFPTAISQTNIMAGQNKHIRLVKARVSWEETASNTNELIFHEEGFISIPGVAENRNRIAPQTITLDADDKVAYVDLNRVAGAAADLTVNVAAITAIALTRDTLIIARRLSGMVVMEYAGQVLNPGFRISVDDPLRIPLKLKEHESDPTRIRVQASDALQADGSTVAQFLDGLLADFGGAVIDTVTGEVFEADGSTALGADYTPPTIAASQFRWFSVALVSNAPTAENRNPATLEIGIADTDGASAAAAKRANFGGDSPVGQYYLQRNAGDTANEAITKANFVHLGQGAGGGGGAGGDPSFTIERVVGDVATMNGGHIKWDDGLIFVTGGGTDSATTGFNADLDLDLATILGTTIANATRYHLYIDRTTLPDPIVLSDSLRTVINVVEANFVLLEEGAKDISPYRYVHIAGFRSADAGNSFSGAGSSFDDAPRFTPDSMSVFFRQPHEKKLIITSETDDTWVHGLGGNPQLVSVYQFDDALGKDMPVNTTSVIKDKNATQIEWGTVGLGVDADNPITITAIFIPDIADHVAGLSSQFESPWFEDDTNDEILHLLTDMDDIKGLAVQRWNTVSGRRAQIAVDELVVDFDNTKIYLDWDSLAPSATLRYRVIAGGSPLPQAVPLYLGGYTKFVGFGVGSYGTIAEAVADSAPGDSILVRAGYVLTALEDVDVDDISITFMPDAEISAEAAAAGLLVSGNRVDIIRPSYRVDLSGTITNLIRVTGDDVNIERARIHVDDAGATVTNVLAIDAASARAYFSLAFRITAGTVTNGLDDQGTDTDGSVRGTTS